VRGSFPEIREKPEKETRSGRKPSLEEKRAKREKKKSLVSISPNSSPRKESSRARREIIANRGAIRGRAYLATYGEAGRKGRIPQGRGVVY